jgi:predicted GIY-YIG superfamily endonuclease
MSICGIYLLRFKGTNKVYIGLSVNIEARFNNHRYNFINNTASDKLQKAYNMYGMPSLEILCEASPEELEKYEKEAIQIFDSIENGFNSRDGGATGAGVEVSGEKNGRAKHNKEVYISVFKLLISNKNYSYKEIAEINSVSIQIVDHIASGVSHRAWLEKEFPEEYAYMLSKVGSRQNINGIELKNTYTGEIRKIYSLLDFSMETGIPKSSLSSLVTGKYKTAGTKQNNVWQLVKPIIYSPKKRQTFKLHNIIENYSEIFNNISEFCKRNNISNRKGFSNFLYNDKDMIYNNTWSKVFVD